MDVTAPLISLWIAVFIFGLMMGSFANVVIARVPEGRSIVRPGSACPACGTPIRPRDNIPVVSWVLLRGRCRSCAEPIAARYPLVEVTVGVVMVAFTIWAGETDRWGLLPLLLVWAFVGVCLTVIDIDHHRLPDALTLPMLVVAPAGLLLAWLLGTDVDWVGALIGAVVWGGFLFLLWLLSGGRGMGLGDVKMAPSIGLTLGALGAGAAVAGLAIGFIVGGVAGVILLIAGRAGRRSHIAFGPFLLVGAFAGVIVGPALSSAYTGLI